MPAMDNSFQTVWQRIEAHQEKPFLMPNGREFHYVIEGEKLRFSCSSQFVEKATITEALQSMPCESFQQLPRHLKPRNALWTLLNDTRIYQRPKFTDYQPNEFWERRSLG
jgi:hypothetical protein